MKKLFAIVLFFPFIILFLSSPNREIIISDLYSHRKKSNSLFQQIMDLSLALFENRCFRSLFYFRTGGNFSKLLRIFFPQERTFIIDRFSVIGPGLQLAHPYSTIINVKQMGENCYINHLVTLGEKEGEKPVIGNNVKFLTNCTVIGGVNVGDNAIIGAGAVVVKDVPENAIVVGNPARIINNK